MSRITSCRILVLIRSRPRTVWMCLADAEMPWSICSSHVAASSCIGAEWMAYDSFIVVNAEKGMG